MDLSIWKNSYAAENSASRSHLLCCLDTILSLMESQEALPTEAVAGALHRYMEDVKSHETIPVSSYPKLLTAAPYHQTEHYLGREVVTSSLVQQLVSGRSCYLHGIGGIGKTEIAKSALKQILAMPASESGFTHVMWVNYTDRNFALSLVRALNITDDIHNLEQAFQRQYLSSISIVAAS